MSVVSVSFQAGERATESRSLPPLEVTREISYPTHDPLRQSVTSLALFAMQAAGADGYSWSEFDIGSETLLPRSSSGIAVPRVELAGSESGPMSCEGVAFVSFPLRVEGALAGHLAFAFRRAAIEDEELSVLSRMAAVVEAVLALPRTTARLATRIGRLDAELAGIKIAERTRGLLAKGAPHPQEVETIVRHVENVLQGRQGGTVLEQLLPDLEGRLEERKLLVTAKAALQQAHGMSEEQAYLHLRLRSRSSRRRLRDVARELIAVSRETTLELERGTK